MEKLGEKEALVEAYDSLINTAKEILEGYIKDYNTEMLRQATQKIDDDLKEHKCYLRMQTTESSDLETIEYNIQQWKTKLNAIKESKERNIK